MDPRIEVLPEKKLVGLTLTMSLSENKTHALWSSFMPRRKEIINNLNTDLISLQVYQPGYFDHFNALNEFEKWALIEVSDFDNVPKNMQSFSLSEGLYAVFIFKGSSKDYESAARFFEYIFKSWLPASNYLLDHRPHFEILGMKHSNESPDSEEEVWIPIKPKT